MMDSSVCGQSRVVEATGDDEWGDLDTDTIKLKQTINEEA